MKYITIKPIALLSLYTLIACNGMISSNAEMVDLLSTVAKTEFTSKNDFCPEATFAFYDSVVQHVSD